MPTIIAPLPPSFLSRLDRLSTLKISVCVAAAAAIVSFIFLWPAYTEFPMDDSYIHLVYAQNLAEHGKLFFSFPNEVGVATSSLLWVLLLAGGHKLGISMYFLARALGIASLAATGIASFHLLDPLWPRWKSLLAALLICFSGNVIWFSTSGMETTLFLALGLISLLLYRAGRWGWLGFTLGLLVLTRPEGLFLAAAIGLLDLFARRRLTRDLMLAAAIAILVCAPWFLYLRWRTGDFLPTSAVGKQLGFSVTINYIVNRYHLPGILRQFPGVIYPLMWIVYLLEFALGGVSLPPPLLNLTNSSANLGATLSVWVFPAFMLVVWLMVQSGRKFFRLQRWREWIQSAPTRILLILFTWAVLHNLVYMFVMPVPGTASRYGALNYILLWIAIVGGLPSLTSRPAWRSAAMAGILFIGLCNAVYWNRVYDANIEHMVNVRIAAAEYVRDRMPDDICAAFDIGALRYFGGRPIVEIAALIDTQANQWAAAGKVDRYLINHNVTCVVLPGRTGYGGDGVYDLAEILRINSSPLFTLELEKAFEIDRQRWLLGYLPTGNYQASAAIYHLKRK